MAIPPNSKAARRPLDGSSQKISTDSCLGGDN